MFFRTYTQKNSPEYFSNLIKDKITLTDDDKNIIFKQLLAAVQKNAVDTIQQWRDCLGDYFVTIIKQTSTDQNTLLHWAGYQENLEIAHMLLDAKADPYVKDNHALTYLDTLNSSLVTAILQKNFDTIQKIMAYDEINLDTKVRGGSPATYLLQSMIEAIQNQNFVEFEKWQSVLGNRFNQFINKSSETNDKLLHYLGRSGNIEIAKKLIEAKADPNDLDSNGLNYDDNLSLSIIPIAKESDFEKLKLLFAYEKINLTVTKYNSSIADFIISCLINGINDIDYLQKWKNCLGDRFVELINKPNSHKDTILHTAAYEGYIDTTEWLIEAKADTQLKGFGDLEFTDNLSISIADLAKEKNFEKIKRILQNKNIDLNISFENQTRTRCPVEAIFQMILLAIRQNNLSELLQWQNCLGNHFETFIHKKDKEQNSLLHWAGLTGNIDFAENLIEKKADPADKNENGLTYSTCLSVYITQLIENNNYIKLKEILAIRHVEWNLLNIEHSTAYTTLQWKLLHCIENYNYKEFVEWRACFGDYILQVCIALKRLDDIENQILHGYLIRIIQQKKFKEMADILLDEKNIDLTVTNEQKMSPAISIKNLIKESIQSDDDKTFILIKASMRDDYFKSMINMKDEEGCTLLTHAILSKNDKFTTLLKESGADLHYDFITNFKKLPPQAFAAAPIIKLTSEIKIYRDTPISSYYKGKSNNDFKAQFNQLLTLYETWGTENKCLHSLELHGLNTLQLNFFNEDYSSIQPNQYFVNIKKNLEKIYMLLKNNDIILNKRTRHFSILCKNFIACSPGLPGHVESVLADLQSSASVEQWLAEKRTSIIHLASDIYNQEHNIANHISIHTYLALHKEASACQWNPLMDTKELHDPFTHMVGFTNNKKGNINRENFRIYFMKEFNSESIRECIKTNLNIELISLCKNYGYHYLETNAMIDNQIFQNFTNRLKAFIDQLGIVMNMEDYIILNEEDYASFKIYPDSILDKICEKVLPVSLYFSTSMKMYRELIPSEWINRGAKDFKDFDFNIWKEISKEQLTKYFIRVYSAIFNERHKKILLTQLTDMDLLSEISQNISILKNNQNNLPRDLLKIEMALQVFQKNKSSIATHKDQFFSFPQISNKIEPNDEQKLSTGMKKNNRMCGLLPICRFLI